MIRLIRFGVPTDAPPLFAIPGLDGTPGSVEPIAERLAQTREVLVVDYSAEDYPTLEALSAAIADLVKAEDHPLIDLMGQSIGTIMAAQVALDLPVRKLALCCTFTRLRGWLLRLSAGILRITPDAFYRLSSDWVVILTCGPVGDGRDHPAFAGARSSDQAGTAKRTAWEIDRDFGIDLARIRAPLLVLMGEQDRFVPNPQREVETLRALFADHPARVETIPNAGHIFLPSAAVALASDKIEAFLE